MIEDARERILARYTRMLTYAMHYDMLSHEVLTFYKPLQLLLSGDFQKHDGAIEKMRQRSLSDFRNTARRNKLRKQKETYQYCNPYYHLKKK